MIKRGVWVCCILALILLTSFAVSNIAVGKEEGVKVSSEVTKELQDNGKARVIVTLKDNNDFDSKGRLTASASSSRTNVIENIGKNKVKNEFSSFNGFSAALTREDIAKLEADDRVESIQYDMPVHIFLQDSVPLINASLAWQVKLNDTNITGAGETICIIDTGIDYTHPDLGNCTIRNLSLIGNIENLTTPVESAHPYARGFDYTWNITMTGFTKIAVHFNYIETEQIYDKIRVYDNNNNLIETYYGRYDDLWTPSVDGDTIKVRLTSDSITKEYDGFYIDKVINGTTNTTYNWDSCNKIINGWDFADNSPNPYDDYGHGTHVAGIAAANGIIKGVAPDAKIVAIKSMNWLGEGYTSDIVAGIDWCVNNASKFNISVISMSLGGERYYSYCDNEPNTTAFRTPVNNAVAKNISVVVATGNNGWIDSISAPACIRNATAVGSTTKTDAVSSFSNRNNITDLFAPGSSIYSTYLNGGYATMDGTSMATPHVAGAFALVRQFERLKTGRILTPAEIENVLNRTGNRIPDTGSGLNFSRINVFNAVSGLVMSTVSPVNGKYYNTKNILINITNSSFAQAIWWNNETANATYSGAVYQNFSDGNYTIIAYANDSYGNLYENSPVFIVDTTSPTIDIIFPQNRTYTNRTLLVNISVSDANLASTWFFNGTANETYTTPMLRTFNEGTNTIIAYANDIAGNINQTNITLSVDTTPPNVSFASPLNLTYNSNIILVNITNSSDSVYVWWNNETANATYSGAVYQNFGDGTDTFYAWANDSAGNLNLTSVTFQVDTIFPTINFTNQTTANGTYSQNWIMANVTASDINLDKIVINLYTSTALYQQNVSTAGAGTLFVNFANLADGIYYLNASANDTAGNTNWTTRFFGIDTVKPSISLNSPDDGNSTSTSVKFNYTVTDSNYVTSCSLVIDSTIVDTDPSVAQGTGTTDSFSYSLSTGTYEWTVNCTDVAGNTGTHATNTIIKTGTSNPSGGDTSPNNDDEVPPEDDYTGVVYNLSSTSLLNETSKLLRQFDKIIFRVNNTTHRLTVIDLNVSRNWTKLQIQSGIIISEFRVGDAKKFDASGDGYNDLYVKLSNVKSPWWVNVTIKEIYEKAIVNVTTSAGENETAMKGTGFAIKQQLSNLWNNAAPFIKENKWWFIGGGIVAIIAIGVFILHRKGYRFNFHIIERKE
jgi:subtilisin family serine protease